MAVVLSSAGAHAGPLEYVKRLRYYVSHYTAWSKSFTFMLIVFTLLLKSSTESTAWHCIELIGRVGEVTS